MSDEAQNISIFSFLIIFIAFNNQNRTQFENIFFFFNMSKINKGTIFFLKDFKREKPNLKKQIINYEHKTNIKVQS